MATAEQAESKSIEDGSPVSDGGGRLGDLAPHLGWWRACVNSKSEKPSGDLICFTFHGGPNHCSCFLLSTADLTTSSLPFPRGLSYCDP